MKTGGATKPAAAHDMSAIDAAHASVWMDEGFSLSSLHGDAESKALTADLNAREKRQPVPSPSVAHGMQTLAAFLSEMEQLSDDEDTERRQTTSATVEGASPTAGKSAQKSKKKKMSTFERTRRNKAALYQAVYQLEGQIRQMR